MQNLFKVFYIDTMCRCLSQNRFGAKCHTRMGMGKHAQVIGPITHHQGISVLKPEGAFYLFVNIKAISSDSVTFCKDLLQATGVAVVPGIGFGSEGYFRFSFATDITTLREGVRRIEKFIKSK